ncbi:MAG TPA: nodulation protein NfeD [Myxococcota bacterium]|nr:nodulation protein NfeD [Myxococcota bacterium]
MRLRAGLAQLAGLLLCAIPLAAGAAHVNTVAIKGSINPASANYLENAIAQSEADGALAVLVELDTQGGLLTATKDIVQAILNARVPVIVFVSPRGAWAASAGAIVTMSGHIAAMAPGTSIGSASPVSATGEGGPRDEDGKRTDVGMEKAEKFTTAFVEAIARQRKRNAEWAAKAVREAEAITQDEALKLGVIDVVAADTDELLRAIEGREVDVAGRKVALHLAGAERRRIEMPPLTRLIHRLADPDLAIQLGVVGLIALYLEFSQPGMILPGVIGFVCLGLAAIAFQILPFSWVGLLLLLLGVGLTAAELFATTHGVLMVAGLLCMLLGGTMVFDLPEVSDLSVSFWSVLVPIVAAFGVFVAAVVFAVGRTLMLRQTAGVDELIGAVGKVISDLDPNGKVFIRGEHWNAVSLDPIPRGARVEVTAVEGLVLRVRRAPGAP